MNEANNADDRLTCFLNPDRFCAADCMAYSVFPDENAHLDSGPKHCTIISSVERTGRSLNIIGGLLNELLKHQKHKEADAKRNMVAPLGPLGVPR